MRIVFSDDGRDFQRRDWSVLVHADPAGTFFHTPEYLKLYWEEFGETPDDLLLAFAEEDDGTQVGVVAFERFGPTLRFLGGTEVTDYLGPVALPDRQERVASALWAALAERDDWSDADLRGLAEDSAWLGLLRKAAEERGFSVEEADDPNGVAPFLRLPPTWDAYLAELPAKLRHEIRRKEKRLAEAGEVRVRTAGPSTLELYLDRFFELHRTSQGDKAVFMVPGMEIFFRRLAAAFSERGVFRLTFVEVSDELVAATVGFAYGDTFSLYNSAFDRGWESRSPGMVLVAEDIRLSIEEGLATFDLLKGDYAYKYRFGARPRAIRRLVVER